MLSGCTPLFLSSSYSSHISPNSFTVYWFTCTGSLLEKERGHPGWRAGRGWVHSCLCVSLDVLLRVSLHVRSCLSSCILFLGVCSGSGWGWSWECLMPPRVSSSAWFMCHMCLCALQLRLCAGHGPKGPQRSVCCCQGRGGSTPGKDCHASNSSGDKGSNILNCLKRKNYLMDSPLTPRISGMILFQSITGRITSAVWLLANAWIYMVFDWIAAGFEWRLFGAIYTPSDKKLTHPSFWPWAGMNTVLRFHKHNWLHQIAPVWLAFDWPLIGLCPHIFVDLCNFCSSFELDIFSIDISWSPKAELSDTELAALWRTAVMLAENHGGFDAWPKKWEDHFHNLFCLLECG